MKDDFYQVSINHSIPLLSESLAPEMSSEYDHFQEGLLQSL